MSREVDQRVVELQFNNTNFEKNTKKSMDSIDGETTVQRCRKGL